MKIAVIGAGVVGTTTAYKLATQGHHVIVFDREPGPAMESSFANGGQLSYGFASPMGSPSLLGKVPAILFGSDPAFKLPSIFTADFMKWSLQFLYHSLPGQYAKDARVLAALVAQSGEAFHEILKGLDFSFGHRKAGKLVLLKSLRDVENAQNSIIGNDVGHKKEVLSWAGCCQLEPALEHYTAKAAGGIWLENDEVGDAASFSEQLVHHCQGQLGVEFHFNTNIVEVRQCAGKVSDVVTATGEPHGCDVVIVCTGVAGTRLLKKLDISLPIFPVMGYSLTAPVGMHAPQVAITDAGRKIVFSRIGDRIRIAGFADFGIASEERRRQRIQDLSDTARTLVPHIADYARIEATWVGARPATPGSLPIVGATRMSGLYLNMGHGMFGWTLSAGAAQSLADLIGFRTCQAQCVLA